MKQVPDDSVPDTPPLTRWTLDRRIPVALLTCLVFQFGALTWWAAKTDNRIEVLEHAVALMMPRLESVTRLEVKVDYLSQQIADSRKDFQAQLDDLKQIIQGRHKAP